jgi:hypothetical protein
MVLFLEIPVDMRAAGKFRVQVRGLALDARRSSYVSGPMASNPATASGAEMQVSLSMYCQKPPLQRGQPVHGKRAAGSGMPSVEASQFLRPS